MKALYILLQWTWGFAQSLLGAAVYLANPGRRHSLYHGAVVTYWGLSSGLSLGMFVFVPEKESPGLLAHEFGHTLQSLLLGPLYLLVIGIPSAVWCNLPACIRYRKRTRRSYYSLYTEKWANHWGARATGDPVPKV